MARPIIGEAQAWTAGALLAFAVHGVGLAALIGGDGEVARMSAAIPISIELGAESEAAQQENDVAPGETRREAAPPEPQRAQAMPEAPVAREAEYAAVQPMRQATDAPPSELAPAPETTAQQVSETRVARAHPRTASYEQILLAHLERNKRYPRAARSQRQQGVVLVRFQMDRQGRILSSRLARSSGHDLLDEEVMELLQRAQPLPAPPHSISGTAIELTVPVEFHLR